MISVIIPTMWFYPDNLRIIIDNLSNEPSVDEIILIVNNKFDMNLSLLNHSKLIVIVPKKNIGCNPAWNLGYKIASNDKLFFLNDDFIFDFSICSRIQPHITEDKGLILSDTNSSTSDAPLRLSPIHWNPYMDAGKQWISGWACGFFVHKKSYNCIPDELKLHCGDNWLLDTIGKQHYILKGISFPQIYTGTINIVRNLDRHHALYIDSNNDDFLYHTIKTNYLKIHTTTNEAEIIL